MVHNLLYRELLFHGATRPYHGYAEEFRTEALAIFGVGDAVVGQQDDEGVVPLRGLSEAFDKLANAVVGIGKGVKVLVLKLVKGHLKRLMAAQCEEGCKPRLLVVLARLQHIEQVVEGDVVGHTPLAVVAVGHREVVLRCQLLKATSAQIALRVGKVDVATV